MRMVSGRGLAYQRARIISEKENFIIKGSKAKGDDDNVNSSINEEARHQYGLSIVPSWHFSDGLTQNSEECDEEWDAFDYFDRDLESRGRSPDHTLAERNSQVTVNRLDKYFDRQPSWKSLVEPKNIKSTHHHRQSHSVSGNATPSRYGYTIEDRLVSSNGVTSEALMQFLSHAPTWAARAAERRVEFWSELTEKQHMSSNVLSTDTLFSAYTVDCDVANHSSSCWEWDASCSVPHPELTKFRSMYLPEWVVSYLDDISLRLRNAGWDEDDIDEIMDTPATSKLPKMEDKQAVVDALSKQAVMLSTSLRKGGWSMRDVAEVLNVDVKFGDHNKLQLVTTGRRNFSHSRSHSRTNWHRQSY